MISDNDVRKIASAGKIDEAELPRLKATLIRWKTQHEKLLEDMVRHPAHKKQLELAKKYLRALRDINESCDEHPESLNMIYGMEMRRVDKLLSGSLLEHALARIPRQRRRWLAMCRRFEDNLKGEIAGLQSNAVLVVTPSATKEASAHLAFKILLYFGSRGRLGEKPPTSDTDPLVRFACDVFALLEGESLKMSAARQRQRFAPSTARRRLASSFERAKVLSTRRVPDLKAERKARQAWIAQVIAEFKAVPTVSEEDAIALANGVPIDLSISPRDAVRAVVASWDD